MPISAAAVGRTLGPREVALSARRIMAFAAGTDDRNPRYFDDTAGPPLAPPLLAVSLEWPLLVALRTELPGAGADEVRRGVHAAHDVTIHRLPVAGETLRTTATVVAIERRPSGAGLLTRLDTVDTAGRPLWTTFNGGVYRGVALAGTPARLDAPPPPPDGPTQGGFSAAIAVPWNAAHVYTECAEIWNPIHTERAVALAAGLPDIILHGCHGGPLPRRDGRGSAGDPRRRGRAALTVHGVAIALSAALQRRGRWGSRRRRSAG
jgi:acyl dehydratase